MITRHFDNPAAFNTSRMISPPLTGNTLQTVYTVFQVVFLFSGLFPPTPYGKFFRRARLQVSSRLGMVIIYLPAFLIACYSFWVRDRVLAGAWNRLDVVNMLLIAHFGKRLLEVLFVHVYSGTLDLLQAMSVITLSYSMNTYMILYCMASISEDDLNPSLLAPGLALFAVGQVINFYHHYLLASLRTQNQKKNTSNGKKEYIEPHGGLFSSTCCPHFFGELIAWIGISLLSQHANCWLVTGGMTSYLLGRSYSTTAFYLKKLPSYKPKYHMIPGIF